MQFDYGYLCQGFGRLSGLEVRVYTGGEMTDHFSPFDFTPDIAGLVMPKLHGHIENVFYIETEELLTFGVIRAKADATTIVIGPTSHIVPVESEAIAILYQLDGTYDKLPQLQAYFQNMVPYPLENFLSILCFLGYAINDEKLSAADLIRNNGARVEALPERAAAKAPAEELFDEESSIHNTYQMEKQMLSLVTTGNVEALRAFLGAPAEGRIGLLAQSELRQRKNALIVTVTLISRAAIAGGMPPETAFAISDRYIQKAELMNSGAALTVLSMEMLLDYTQRVEALKCGAEDSRLAQNVTRYILKNISHKISTADIAGALQINRAYLCDRFKQDTGRTVGEFITQAKIDEAKRMLEISNLTIAEVGEYLAFSTQSYFQTVFKKLQGCTPKEYRLGNQTSPQ